MPPGASLWAGCEGGESPGCGRALLRRTGFTTVDNDVQIVVGDLMLDEDSHEVTRAGEPITSTSTEFELLRYFMRNPRRVLSKAQILDRVWSYDFGGRSNIVELYVSYQRRARGWLWRSWASAVSAADRCATAATDPLHSAYPGSPRRVDRATRARQSPAPAVDERRSTR